MSSESLLGTTSQFGKSTEHEQPADGVKFKTIWKTGPGFKIPFYVCPDCGKEFSLKGNLKKHYMIHTDTRPFVCPLCNKGFRQNYSYVRHMKIHQDAL